MIINIINNLKRRSKGVGIVDKSEDGQILIIRVCAECLTKTQNSDSFISKQTTYLHQYCDKNKEKQINCEPLGNLRSEGQPLWNVQENIQ